MRDKKEGYLGQVPRMRARALSSFVDQAIASLTNFVVLFAALRLLSVSDLGRFTLAYATAFLVLGIVRPLALEPLTVRFAARSPEDRNAAAGKALGFSVLVGTILVLASVLTLLFAWEHSGLAVTLAFAILVLLVQDGWRVFFFAAERIRSALVNDAVCLVATVALVTFILVRFRPNVTILLAAWGLGVAAGAVTGLFQSGVTPRPKQGVEWIHSVRTLGFGFAGEVSLERIAAHLSLLVIGAISGAAALGEVGGSRTLMSPVLTVVTGVAMFATPEAVRMRSAGDIRRLARFAFGVSTFLAVSVLLFTFAALAVPPALGEMLVGRNWDSASPLLLPVGLWTAAAAARYGPRMVLQALEKSSLMFRLALLSSPLIILSAGIGAFFGDSRGASWAFALSYCVSATVWWLALRGPLRSARCT